MYSLRGKQAKEKLIREYDVRPFMYAVVLDGIGRQNQCGGNLLDKYYAFLATNKDNSKKEIFFVGYDCGEQILELLNIPKNSLTLFNPIKSINNNASLKKPCRILGQNDSYSSLAKELFNITCLIVVNECISNSQILSDILLKISSNKTQDPKPSDFKSINTYLERIGKSIYDIIDELISKGNDIKKFNFDKSKQYLLQKYPEITKVNF